MPDTITVTARLLPGDDSPPLRSSRCVLRTLPVHGVPAWVGEILVSCGERETTLLLVIHRDRNGWRLETRLAEEEDPCCLSIGIPNMPGEVPGFVTSPWYFLNTDWGVRVAVEPAE